MRLVFWAALVATCAGCGMTLPPRTAFVKTGDVLAVQDADALTDGLADADGSPSPDAEVAPADVDLPDLPDALADVAPDSADVPQTSDSESDVCDANCDAGEDAPAPDVCQCGDKTCSSSCGESLTTCPVDCAKCGDGVCSPGEDPKSCSADCCGTCGDGDCRCAETAGNCAGDCPAGCGDGACTGTETKITCPNDCKTQGQICGDGVCEPGDGGPLACPQDCDKACGNCSCQPGEDYLNCPVDCGYCGDGICSLCAGSGESLQTCPADCKGGDAGTCKSIVCDDGNVCTSESCVAGQGCVYAPAAGPCSDGDACTSGDACSAGECLPGAATECDDGNPCTADGCDKSKGCTHPAASAGAPCSDGNVCTQGDACAAGACLPGTATDCDDGDVCTSAACDGVTGCSFTANTDACSDGNGCTLGDACVAGVCTAGAAAPNCDDGTPCTTDACLPATGCTHSAAPAGTACSDGSLCTVDDACSAGACVPGTTTTCDDGNDCTTDSCATLSGCVFAPNTATCDDGNECTQGDVCGGGTCAGVTKLCKDSNGCTDDSCNPLIGCVFSANSATCNDGNACTKSDVCAASVCAGVAYSCSALDACHVAGTCKGDGTCTNPAKADGSACADANLCTTGDKCLGGGCTGGSGVLGCDDGKTCTTDGCNPATGCTNAPVGNGTSCSDGSACTTGDTCQSGACQGGAALGCDDNNVCTTDTCIAATGCHHANAAVGTACGAGKTCDGAGNCAPTGMVLVPAGTFWMGCNSAKDANCSFVESPQHKVTLSAYYADLTETTVAQYKACVDAGACTAPGSLQPSSNATYPGLLNNPVNYVNWTQARQFCAWRGPGYDLPTEAQWEMAARGSCEKNGSAAGDPNCKAAMRTYPWGETTADCTFAVMSNGASGCGTGATWAVGSKPAGDGPYGMHDMAGNVGEWTRDGHALPAGYPPGDQIDPVTVGSAAYYLARGGQYDCGAACVRASSRGDNSPDFAPDYLGFRCTRPFDLCAGVTCPDLACATQACEPTTGKCVATPKTDGLACNDGLICTTGATCQAGVCGTPTNCDDSNDCTTDSCAAATGCVHMNVSAGTACGAGGTCNGAGTCDTSAPAGMVLVPAGTFWMGCNATKDAGCNPDEKPQHKVTLSSYYIDANETTVAQYKACVAAGVCSVPGKIQATAADATYPDLAQNPVNYVSWTQAQAYCKWRGADYDLPTEAQWEMAARGSCEKNGSTAGDAGCAAAMRTFPWGEATPTCSYAVLRDGPGIADYGCATGKTWAVGSKPAGDSPYGLHDMAANVAEWNRDWYGSAYSAAAQTDPTGPVSGTDKPHRGGTFENPAVNARSAAHSQDPLSYSHQGVGLRCVRTGGLCAGVTCPSLPCATNTCDGTTGKCVATPKNDGSTCDDGSQCTTGDTCTAGTCTGTAKNCNDGNGCTADSCVAATGCGHASVSAGTACSDGDACTTGDVCTAGVCKGTAPVCGNAKCDCGETAATCPVDCNSEPPMVVLPAGTFAMGSPDGVGKSDEHPQHQVSVSEFAIDKSEVTVAQYKLFYDQLSAGQKCGGSNSGSFLCGQPGTGSGCNWGVTGKEQHPANCTDWFQANAYCAWAHVGGRLVTEAEFEYAARSGGKDQTFPWGNQTPTCTLAVMDDGGIGCGVGGTWPVCSKTPGNSSQGACDLVGNVVEWCADWYGPYTADAQTNPTGPGSGTQRSVRAGSFFNDAVVAVGRSAVRDKMTPSSRYFDFGFRCAKTLNLCSGVSCPELACATQTCDATTGKCVATPKSDGLACNDGLVCTTGSTCLAGVCGTATNCDDGNACTVDSCDAALGCRNAGTLAGTGCASGKVCDMAGTCVTGLTGMTLIPAGTFWMGCNAAKDANCTAAGNETAQHKVSLSAYYIDVTETTVAQYKACVDAGVCTVPDAGCTIGDYGTWGVTGKEQNPLNCPSWTQSQTYCKWRGTGFDLPTEAQWEMAARGSCEKNGSTAGDPGCAAAMRTYPWGEAVPSCSYTVFGLGNDGCGTGLPWAVGQKTAGDSPYGVHDLAGNIWEWTRDWYASTYAAGAQTDPLGPGSGSTHAIRGGSFGTDASDLRSSRRSPYSPSSTYGGIGLRCSRTFP